MNGYTIENKTAGSYSEIDDAGDECIVFLVKGEGAHLTLNATNGGSVRATGDGVKSNFNVAVWVADGAKATINGGEYSNAVDTKGDGCDLIYARNGSTISVNGGKFTPAERRSDLGKDESNDYKGVYAALNCKDKSNEFGQSTITISGGQFYQFGAKEASLVGSGEVILLKNGCSWSEIDKDGYYSVVSAN